MKYTVHLDYLHIDILKVLSEEFKIRIKDRMAAIITDNKENLEEKLKWANLQGLGKWKE